MGGRAQESTPDFSMRKKAPPGCGSVDRVGSGGNVHPGRIENDRVGGLWFWIECSVWSGLRLHGYFWVGLSRRNSHLTGVCGASWVIARGALPCGSLPVPTGLPAWGSSSAPKAWRRRATCCVGTPSTTGRLATGAFGFRGSACAVRRSVRRPVEAAGLLPGRPPRGIHPLPGRRIHEHRRMPASPRGAPGL